MKAHISITAILILVAINCSSQSAEQIRQKQQKKASTKPQTAITTEVRKQPVIARTTSSKPTVPVLKERTTIPDSLKPKITTIKKN